MSTLQKYIFIIFFSGILLGHGLADAQENPGQKVKNACKRFTRLCTGIRGEIPVFPKMLKAKNCTPSLNGKGVTYLVFIKNVSQQQAQQSASQQDSKKTGVCETVKKAHKTCQIVAKKGKMVLSDRIQVFDNKGDRKCDQSRKQVDAKDQITTKPTTIVARSDRKTQRAARGKKTMKKFKDTRTQGIKTKVTMAQ